MRHRILMAAAATLSGMASITMAGDGFTDPGGGASKNARQHHMATTSIETIIDDGSSFSGAGSGFSETDGVTNDQNLGNDPVAGGAQPDDHGVSTR